MIQGTKIYSVSVANAAGSTNEEKGFLDNKKVSDYSDFDISTQPVEGETLEQYKIKARGLVRYNQMCLNLQRGLDYLGEVETTGANHITPPTKLEFKVAYSQPDGLCVQVADSDYEEDEEIFKTRDGRVFFKGTKAIKRLIAMVLVDDYTVIANYFDNTKTPSGNPLGWQLKELVVKGPIADLETAEALVTITELL